MDVQPRVILRTLSGCSLWALPEQLGIRPTFAPVQCTTKHKNLAALFTVVYVPTRTHGWKA